MTQDQEIGVEVQPEEAEQCDPALWNARPPLSQLKRGFTLGVQMGSYESLNPIKPISHRL